MKSSLLLILIKLHVSNDLSTFEIFKDLKTSTYAKISNFQDISKFNFGNNY